MTSTLSPARTGFDAAAIAEMSDADLFGVISAGLKATARHLLDMATAWAELERRGHDLSGLRRGWARFLPLIAAGTVEPDVLIKFDGEPYLLSVVALLPPDQQRKLCDGEPVKLVVKEGGRYTHRLLPADALEYQQVRQVFDPVKRCVRTEAEQIAILTAASAPKPVRRQVGKRGRCAADGRAGVVRIGRSYAPAEEMIDALRQAGMI